MGNFLTKLATNLVLGGIPLTVDTATYNRVSQSLASNWSKQNRINNTPILQHSGTQTEEMSISGITFKDQKTAQATIATIREMVISDRPKFLLSLDGLVYGKWAIDGISEESSDGDKSSYTISLTRYHNKSLIGYAKNMIN